MASQVKAIRNRKRLINLNSTENLIKQRINLPIKCFIKLNWGEIKSIRNVIDKANDMIEIVNEAYKTGETTEETKQKVKTDPYEAQLFVIKMKKLKYQWHRDNQEDFINEVLDNEVKEIVNEMCKEESTTKLNKEMIKFIRSIIDTDEMYTDIMEVVSIYNKNISFKEAKELIMKDDIQAQFYINAIKKLYKYQ